MKTSAGLLVYRQSGEQLEVLIVHMGGPFQARKDKGSWTIPKGEYEEGEEPLVVAKREFEEETGQLVPAGPELGLGEIKQSSGKVVTVWAVEGDPDISEIKSNTFKLEWPPRSGNIQEFPEIDKAEWFTPEQAVAKLIPAQTEFIDRLIEKLGYQTPRQPQQSSLF